MTEVRTALREAIPAAMRARDREALSAYRIAAAAIDNAEALPTEASAGAIELSPVGVGAAEAPRRTLTEAEARAIVQAEIAELGEGPGARALTELLAGLE